MSDVTADPVEEPTSSTPRRSWATARNASLAGLAVYVIATIILVNADGILLSRDTIFAWLLVGMLMVSLADLKGWARGMIFDWLPYFALLFLYDFLRGQVGQNPIYEPHVMPQIDFDKFLFGGEVPSVWLQDKLWDPVNIDAIDIAAWGVYVSHFFMVFVISAFLWRLARPKFLEFRAMVITLSMAAFATYALFPAVPPWMASDQGAIGPITRSIGNVWDHLGVGTASAIWGHGSDWANPVAAVPSLHTGFPVLIMCFFWGTGKKWVRGLCLTYALAMSFTLVYTGEHYVFDIVLGWLYAIATFLIVRKVRSAFGSWREKRAGSSDSTAVTPPATAMAAEGSLPRATRD